MYGHLPTFGSLGVKCIGLKYTIEHLGYKDDLF